MTNISTRKIHFTGQFELDPKSVAERLGATIVGSVSEGVDFVVTGRSPSTPRIDHAKHLGIKVMDEKGFFDHLELQHIWSDHQTAKAAWEEQAREEARQREIERAKARDEADEARRVKRLTMPHTKVTAEILTERDENPRLIEGEEYQNLTADQLREAINYGENDPYVVRDPDGTLSLVNAEFRGSPSSNFILHEREILLYEDGTFEQIDEDEDEEDEDEDEVEVALIVHDENK
jgi:hypothetical protein